MPSRVTTCQAPYPQAARRRRQGSLGQNRLGGVAVRRASGDSHHLRSTKVPRARSLPSPIKPSASHAGLRGDASLTGQLAEIGVILLRTRQPPFRAERPWASAGSRRFAVAGGIGQIAVATLIGLAVALAWHRWIGAGVLCLRSPARSCSWDSSRSVAPSNAFAECSWEPRRAAASRGSKRES